MHAHVFHHLQVSTEHILLDVNEYKRARQDLILMMRNSDDEKIMRAMDDERTSDIQNALRLELDGQRAHDNEIGQFNEDILHHENASTDQIIENFATLRHDDSFDSHLCHMCGDVHNINEDCFGDDGPSIFNEASEWWVEPPKSSDGDSSSVEDDLNENTDTEDGAEELVPLIQANMKLLQFLTKQSRTIARLRARIVRLSILAQDLTTRLNDPASRSTNNQQSSSTTESASVLVDAHVDLSFLLKPHHDSQVDMTRLDHLQIQNNSKRNWLKFEKSKIQQMSCGCILILGLPDLSSPLHHLFVSTFNQLVLLMVHAP
jgi:hypothetical protein